MIYTNSKFEFAFAALYCPHRRMIKHRLSPALYRKPRGLLQRAAAARTKNENEYIYQTKKNNKLNMYIYIYMYILLLCLSK